MLMMSAGSFADGIVGCSGPQRTRILLTEPVPRLDAGLAGYLQQQ